MKKTILSVVVCLLIAVTVSAQNRLVESGTAAARQTAFEQVWTTVNERHFDPQFGGVDWQAMKRKYAPLVARAKSDQAVHRLLNQMLGELHQSHFGVIPPELLTDQSAASATPGTVGVTVEVLEEEAVLANVTPHSAAARAGLRAGFVVKAIDGVAVKTLLKQVRTRVQPLKLSSAPLQFNLNMALQLRLNGKPGTNVRVQYADERAQVREATLMREAPTLLTPAFGNLPPVPMEFEMKRLAGGVAYIRFSVFHTPVMERLRAALRELHDAPALVLDLRGNVGGLANMPNGLAGLLEQRELSLGTMRMRTGELRFPVFPQANSYRHPVAILIDSGSMSAAEVFAAGMQESGRALIVGSTSLGAALPAQFAKLPTGALFMFAFADFATPKGVRLEGRGVIPDIASKATRAALLAGRDLPLEAALAALSQRALVK